MWLLSIKDYFVFLTVVHEIIHNPLEGRQVSFHAVDLPVDIGPLILTDPSGWIDCHLNVTSGTKQQETPLPLIHLIRSTEDSVGQQEGKQQLMLLEEGSAHVLVETVRYGLIEIHESVLKDLLLRSRLRIQRRCRCGFYHITEQVDEPLQRVLVHGIDC